MSVTADLILYVSILSLSSALTRPPSTAKVWCCNWVKSQGAHRGKPLLLWRHLLLPLLSCEELLSSVGLKRVWGLQIEVFAFHRTTWRLSMVEPSSQHFEILGLEFEPLCFILMHATSTWTRKPSLGYSIPLCSKTGIVYPYKRPAIVHHCKRLSREGLHIG